MKRKSLVTIAVFLVMFFAMLITMRSDKIQAKTSSSEVNAEKNSSPDIVFIGSSAIYRYIIPALVWKDTGMTSYTIGWPAQSFAAIPELIKKSESSLHPSLYVIEVRRLIVKDTEKGKENVKAAFKTISNYDSAPNDKNVMNRLADSFFSRVSSNNNYKNLQDLSIADQESIDKGAVTIASIKRQTEWNPSPYKNKRKPLRNDSKATLYNLLNLCKKKQLNVLFVSTTYVENKLSITKENYAADIIKSYGYPYLNYNYDYKKIGINFATDFYDNHHVNALGAVKVTNYLAGYIKSNYSFPHVNTRATNAAWNNIYKAWTALNKKQQQEIHKMINK